MPEKHKAQAGGCDDMRRSPRKTFAGVGLAWDAANRLRRFAQATRIGPLPYVV